jgi:hypothetical protein
VSFLSLHEDELALRNPLGNADRSQGADASIGDPTEKVGVFQEFMSIEGQQKINLFSVNFRNLTRIIKKKTPFFLTQIKEHNTVLDKY